MTMLADPVSILLAALSLERIRAPIGPWLDSPDLAGWLLKNGQHFNWTTDKLPPGVRTGAISHCFKESQLNALNSRNLIYCEGYAFAEHSSADRPVPHAWCLHRKNGVVDTVWRNRQTKKRIYFGVPFKTSFVKKFWDTVGKDLSILMWSEADWPVQNGKVTELEWKEQL